MGKTISSILLLIICMTTYANENTVPSSDTTLYSEKWRPQYHYTPAHRWIGDPCGLVHFNGRYHAYCWGRNDSNVELFSLRNVTDVSLTAYPVKSIWKRLKNHNAVR